MRHPAGALALVTLCIGSALGGVEIDARSGDTISGTLDPGTEVEKYRVLCPKGAALRVRAKAPKGGPLLHVRVLDGAGQALAGADGSGKSVALAVASIPVSAAYAVEVSSADGTTRGGYSLALSWKSPTRFSTTATLATNTLGTLDFAADAGSVATLSAKPGKHSSAHAVLDELTAPDLTSTPFSGSSAVRPLTVTGDYTLAFGNLDSPQGPVSASVKLKPAKAAKRKLDLTSTSAPSDVSPLAADVLGALGGEVSGEASSPITGASVQIPAGALETAVTILIGTGTTVRPSTAELLAPGGPAIFFGPEGLLFAGGRKAVVTIPFDVSHFPNGTSSLRVFTRAANGSVSEVTDGLTVNALAGTVSFSASHFSTFQVQRSVAAALRTRIVRQSGTLDADHFGQSVAFNDDASFLVVGSGDFDTAAGADAGAVFVHTRTPTGYDGPVQMLTAADGQAGDRFGASVAMSGQVLAVGAPGRDQGAGKPDAGFVYIFTYTGSQWFANGNISSTFFTANSQFGASVAISGPVIVGGAPGDGRKGSGAGSAQLVQFSASTGQWNLGISLFGDTASTGDAFGTSVAISGDTIIVGAPNDGAPNAPDGSACVFRHSGAVWPQEAHLAAVGADGRFGLAVAVASDLAAVGRPLETDSAGSVITYTRSGTAWSVFSQFQGDGTADEEFGSALALNGNVLAVGAPRPASAGRTYLFRQGVASFALTAVGIDAVITTGDRAGTSVALSPLFFASGAPSADVFVVGTGTVTDAGAAAVFDVP